MSTKDFYGSDIALEQTPERPPVDQNVNSRNEEIYRLRKHIYELDKE